MRIILRGLIPKSYPAKPQTIGQHVKRCRLGRKLTQREAARLIGVSPWTVLTWETGHTEPPIEVMPAILKFLDFDPYHRDIIAERSLSTEAQVLGILCELAEDGSGTVPVQKITAQFFEKYGAEYSRPITNKWIGYVLRTRLHLPTYKTSGVYVVPMGDTAKLEVLREKYGIAVNKETEPANGDVGT